MNSIINNPALIPFTLILSLLITFPACNCRDRERQPELIKFSSKTPSPGAIQIHKGKLSVQHLGNLGIKVYNIDLNARKLHLSEKARRIYLRPSSPEKRFKYLRYPASQILNFSSHGIEGLIFRASEGYCPYNQREKTKLDFPLPPSDAMAMTATKECLYAIGYEHTYVLPEGRKDWISGTPVREGARFSGLCHVPASGSFFTTAPAGGEIVELKISKRADSEVVNRHSPVTRYPFNIIYEPDEDVFWISDPEKSIIVRVKRSRVISSSPTRREDLSSYKRISSDITTDEIWRGPVLVQNEITVSEDAKLILEAGCGVRFRPDAGLKVAGTLDIRGTPENPVTLTSSDRNGYWKGINLLQSSHASIEYANLSRFASPITSGGKLNIRYSRIEFAPGIGIRLLLSEKNAGRTEITSNFFDGIAAEGILVESRASTVEHRINISRNCFSHVGKAVSINPHSDPSTSFHIHRNIIDTARKNVFKAESAPMSDSRINIEENVIERGAISGPCLSLKGVHASVSSNFLKNCAVAAVYFESSAGKIENNAIKWARSGIVVNEPASSTLVKGNSVEAQDIAFAAYGGEMKTELVSPWGKELLSLGDSNARRDISMPLDYSPDGTSGIPSFLTCTVISNLSRLPVPAHPIKIKENDTSEPITVITNIHGRCSITLPEGSYMIKAEGGILWRIITTKAGKLTKTQLDAP